MASGPEGSTIQVSLGQDARHWLIDTADNGPGVDESQLPQIFTAFIAPTAAPHKPGTGLGVWP